jgi:hypothetical protein
MTPRLTSRLNRINGGYEPRIIIEGFGIKGKILWKGNVELRIIR